MGKKGVELSMNVIIIAAIGLLVLVILAVLVINSSSKVPGATQSCAVQGGICQTGICSNPDATVAAKDCVSPKTCCKVIVAGG